MLSLPAAALAQSNTDEVPIDESAFVQQAPEDQSSKVYFPDQITPESVARARSETARQQQIELAQQERAQDATTQVSVSGDSGNEVAQLSGAEPTEALAQLSEAERQVLLEAVEGSDICDRGSDIPALQTLCESRLETRSAEFSQQRSGSAEDSLLGGGLDADRVATLEAAINRLARSGADSSNLNNQAIASVALGNQALSDAQATAAEGDPTAELSQETQALVAAIVQQLGGGN